MQKKTYMRIEAVVYAEVHDGEQPGDVEDRFLTSLPDGIDCASYKSDMWIPDDDDEKA